MMRKFPPGIVLDPNTMKRILRENTSVLLTRTGSLTVALQELHRSVQRLLKVACEETGDVPPKVHWSTRTDWSWDLGEFHEGDESRADDISLAAWRLLYRRDVDRLACMVLRVESPQHVIGSLDSVSGCAVHTALAEVGLHGDDFAKSRGTP